MALYVRCPAAGRYGSTVASLQITRQFPTVTTLARVRTAQAASTPTNDLHDVVRHLKTRPWDRSNTTSADHDFEGTRSWLYISASYRLSTGYNNIIIIIIIRKLITRTCSQALSMNRRRDLTLLVGWQEGHPARRTCAIITPKVLFKKRWRKPV